MGTATAPRRRRVHPATPGRCQLRRPHVPRGPQRARAPRRTKVGSRHGRRRRLWRRVRRASQRLPDRPVHGRRRRHPVGHRRNRAHVGLEDTGRTRAHDAGHLPARGERGRLDRAPCRHGARAAIVRRRDRHEQVGRGDRPGRQHVRLLRRHGPLERCRSDRLAGVDHGWAAHHRHHASPSGRAPRTRPPPTSPTVRASPAST